MLRKDANESLNFLAFALASLRIFIRESIVWLKKSLSGFMN